MTRLYLPGRDVENLDRLQEEYRHLPEGLPEVRIRKATQLDPTLRGGEREGEVEVPDASADDVLEIVFEGGTTRWVSVATAMEEQEGSATRGKRGPLRIPSTWGSTSKTRGGAGEMRAREVRVLETRLPEAIVELAATASARMVAKYFENKLVDSGPGLYHYLEPNHLEKVVSPARLDPASPYLLFLHGTASSTVGSFGQLGYRHAGDTLKLGDTVEWEKLKARYPERMLGYEHRTFSESPIRNALELAELLPEQATLHLLSHSRGGLVGELLCLGQMEELLDPATARAKIDQLLRPWREADREEDRQDLEALLTLLPKKRFKIDKFVRVACPARGTVALAGRLDLTLSLLLNLLGAIPVFSASPTYRVIKSLVLELVKRRTDPKVLPGIEAMMPGSPLVYTLNNLGLSTKSDLAVVAGDIEGGDLLQRLTVFLTDRFFREDHDLVVNCAAMKGGLRRTSATVYEDEGREVSHFNYFRNLDTRSRIAGYLLAPAEDRQKVADVGFAPLIRERGASPSQRRSQVDRFPEKKGTLFLLPGMMGSQLCAPGERPLWLNPVTIGEQGLRGLKLDQRLEAKALLPGVYDRLIEHLGGVYEVVPFPYDWRRSIKDAARKLAERVRKELDGTPHPVRFLGHSAGGLVVRAMMAMEPDLWRRVSERGGRLLMLGTPNRGSYWVARLLAGEARLIHELAMLELEGEGQDLPALFCTFPGMLELLPERLLQPEGWSRWKSAQPPAPTALEEARQVREELDRSLEKVDRSSMVLVAGVAALTPSDLREDRAPHVFVAGAAGDGRVTHQQAKLDKVRTWSVSASHGSLADYPASFPGLLELLERGETRQLREGLPLSQREEEVLDPEMEIPAVFPAEADLIASAIGMEQKPEEFPILHLSIVHANLRDASYPIMVGHYREDAIVGAEAHIDRLLGWQLSRMFQLGLYPGPEGTVEIFDAVDPQTKHLKGALVLGLGEMGQLTREKIRAVVTEAAVRYALRCQQKRQASEGTAKEMVVSLSTLLLGTYSNSQLSVYESVQAILQGVIQANRLLESVESRERDAAAGEATVRVRIGALEIVELYQDIASQAIEAVQEILQNPSLDHGQASLVLDSPYLKSKRGGRPQRPADLFAAGWWRRVKITVEDALEGTPAPERRMRLTVLTDRARVEEEELITQRRLIDRLVEQSIDRYENDSDLNAALFELMVPVTYKDQLLSQGDLVLVVDGEAANYPWELMACRSRDEVRPIALGRGIIRQLVTARPLPLRPAANGDHVLVIGDPQLDERANQLDGAKQEAEQVAQQLQSGGYQVEPAIQDAPLALLRRLFEREYRIIHVAGHGYFDAERPTNSGLLLGEGLWLGSAEFRQLRALPDLVFLNCCHLGKMERKGEQWNRLAASLSQELIGMGVKAVVAAGWAIDDQAALTFAKIFYQEMLEGKGFGEAVRSARDEVYAQHPQSNTWGAYQCYGNPDFKLRPPNGKGRSSTWRAPLTSQQAKDRLKAIWEDSREGKHQDQTREQLKLMHDSLPGEWLDGEMLGLLGDVWGSLGDFDRAIDLYYQAKQHESGLISLWTLQQFANLLVRSLTPKNQAPPPPGKIRERLADAEKLLLTLSRLNETNETSELLALFGSLYKRWAQFEKLSKSRQERLRKAAEKYQEAYEVSKKRSGQGDPYPGLNWLSCEYVVRQHRAKSKPPSGDEADSAPPKELSEILQTAAKMQQSDDVYQRLHTPDAELLVALFKGPLTDEDVARIGGGYRDALRGRADQKEIDSVRAQFDFFLEMLPRDWEGGREDLSAIQQSISA